MMGRAPDFICIGAAKAGTTWLYEALAASPGYWMTPMKELNYFGHPTRNQRLLQRLGNLEHIADPKRREWVANFLHAEPRNDNWYRALFASAGRRVTGDISPPYARIGVVGIEHAKRVAPHAKIIMFARNPADRDLSHLIHIATDKVLGTPKLAAVMDAIALHLDLTGDRMEKRRQARAHFKLNREDVRSMDRLLAVLTQLAGRPVSFADVPEMLGKKITLDDVRAARARPVFMEQRSQSEALRRWGGVFGTANVFTLLYDDLVSDAEGLFARVTDLLGRKSQPRNASLLRQVSNPNTYRIEGLEELRAELAQECAAEREALRAIFGNNLPAWSAN